MRRRTGYVLFASLVAVLVAAPALAQRLDSARLVQAPDGVLFVITDGTRHRVTPAQMSYAELGAIPEGPALALGQLAPAPGAASGPKRVVVPSAEMGLSRDKPIPLGWTCSCTIDRAGLVSKFDVTITDVVQDAQAMVQGMNRFNKPPRENGRYVAVYVDIKYIDGPRDQAYTIQETDFHAVATDEVLRDGSPLLFAGNERRTRQDVYPGAYVHGWNFFELTTDRPAVMVWPFSLLGERGIWFALQ
ncbi:MAG: hypothetical protein U0821_21970 [Chloroflexota bacterium]